MKLFDQNNAKNKLSELRDSGEAIAQEKACKDLISRLQSVYNNFDTDFNNLDLKDFFDQMCFYEILHDFFNSDENSID